VKPALVPLRGWGTRRRTWLLIAVLAVVAFGEAHAEGVRWESVQIQAAISGSKTYSLEALVVRPDDGAAHPLAVINHGSPRDAADRPKMSPFRLWTQAVQFARRGWVAVAFLRRGYGRSDGGWVENFGSCGNPDYASAGRTAASDIAAVARYMIAQSYVSKDKWISVGVSAGGFATVALTAAAPAGLVAAIAFAPGRGSRSPDQVCSEKELVAAFAQYGRTSRTPLLWVSAPNDHFFGPRLVKELTGAFSDAGGNVTFVAATPFGKDGHQLFGQASGIPVWSPIVDRFLGAHGLALRDSLIDVPVANVAPPSSLGANGREAFRSYLDSGPNKAFAVSGGRFGWVSGRRSVDDAIKDALGHCASGAAICAVVNVNDGPR
jgi:dienelactone hydrolase